MQILTYKVKETRWEVIYWEKKKKADMVAKSSEIEAQINVFFDEITSRVFSI